MRLARLPLVALALGCSHLAAAPEGNAKPPKPVAGKADVLKHVPKQFATLVKCDLPARKVTLRIEGEKADSTWPVLPDAELKIHGWWGRLDQFVPGDRVWAWFAIDRDKKPRAILMMADELSEQDIHGSPLVIKGRVDGTLTLQSEGEEKAPVLRYTIPDEYEGPVETASTLYVQSAGETIRTAVPAGRFEELRERQRTHLRTLWRTSGLPGTVSALHPLGGEMDLLLDHEGLRWGRYLKNGDAVTLRTARPIKAVVRSVHPWRERTRLRLVTNSGLDQMDLAVGQRIGLLVPEPPQEVQASHLPTDLGRREGRQERVDWFLSTIYCSCGIAGDRCTGMFYIQASCNVNACGTPREMARRIGRMIDEGLTDREIFEKLVADRGRDIWQPHLLR